MSIGEFVLIFSICTAFTGHCVFHQYEIKKLPRVRIFQPQIKTALVIFPGLEVLPRFLDSHKGQSDW